MGVATRLGSFAFFAAVWVWMMAVMMLPGAGPDGEYWHGFLREGHNWEG